MKIIICFVAIMILTHFFFATISQIMDFNDYWIVGIIYVVSVAALFGFAVYKGWLK